MPEVGCEALQALIPELALGVLHGRERAEVLVHVEHCPACQHELLLLGDVADRLVELTPPAEPPVGFETRVMAALRTGRPLPPAHLRQPLSGNARPGNARPGSARPKAGGWWRPAAKVMVAAAVTASVGVGGWALGRHDTRTSPAVPTASGKAVVAELLNDRRPVGQVVVTGVRYPWLSMTVLSPPGDHQLTCEVGLRDGTWLRVGSFTVSNGAGYWASRMPYTTSPITGYRVVDGAGHTVGVASFPAKT